MTREIVSPPHAYAPEKNRRYALAKLIKLPASRGGDFGPALGDPTSSAFRGPARAHSASRFDRLENRQGRAGSPCRSYGTSTTELAAFLRLRASW